MFGFNRLRHHCCDEIEALQFRLVISVRLELQINTKRADRLAFNDNRNTQVCNFLLVQIALTRTIQEHRFTADHRNDDRFAGFDDAARDSFAQTVPGKPAGVAQSAGYFDSYLLSLCIQQCYGAPNETVPPLQSVQNSLKRDSW